MKKKDRVFLTEKNFLSCPSYPVIDTTHECVGTVIKVRGDRMQRIEVMWDNGEFNSFDSSCLTLVKNMTYPRCKSIWSD